MKRALLWIHNRKYGMHVLRSSVKRGRFPKFRSSCQQLSNRYSVYSVFEQKSVYVCIYVCEKKTFFLQTNSQIVWFRCGIEKSNKIPFSGISNSLIFKIIFIRKLNQKKTIFEWINKKMLIKCKRGSLALKFQCEGFDNMKHGKVFIWMRFNALRRCRYRMHDGCV